MTNTNRPQTARYSANDGSMIEYTLRNGRYSTTTHVRGYAKVQHHVDQKNAWAYVQSFLRAHAANR